MCTTHEAVSIVLFESGFIASSTATTRVSITDMLRVQKNRTIQNVQLKPKKANII